MSAFLLGLGFRANMGTCCRKLVLLKLIDACEEDGTRIFPAMATVARAAQCSTRQAQREIRAFCEAGLLRLVRAGGKGPRSTNEYELDLDVLGKVARDGWDAFTGRRSNEPEPESMDDSIGDSGADPGDEPQAEDDADGGKKGDTVSPLSGHEKGDTGDA